jgi:hypothetical protein
MIRPCLRVITQFPSFELSKNTHHGRRRVRLRTSRSGPRLNALVLRPVSAALSNDASTFGVVGRDLGCRAFQIPRGLVDRSVDERRAAFAKQKNHAKSSAHPTTQCEQRATESLCELAAGLTWKPERNVQCAPG